MPLQAEALDTVATRIGATSRQVALAWLLQRAANILLITGTSSLAHLRENSCVADLQLPADSIAMLNSIAKAA
jgi:aryl-alcohol dehydrogenase-like predicted oxidoreductase